MSTAPRTGPFTRRRLLGYGLAALGGGVASTTLPALLGAIGGGVAHAAAGQDDRLVAVVGDSLTVGTLPYQADAFAAVGWTRSAVNGYGSRGIATKVAADPYTGLTAVDAIRAANGEPDLWIVALGTNDAGLVGSSSYATLIGRMLDAIGEHPVMWVNVHLPKTPVRAAAWNSALAAAAQQPGREMSVYDWASLAAAHGAWLSGDGVHYTGAGYQQRAAAIAAASIGEWATAATAAPSPAVRIASDAARLVAAGEPARFVPLATPVRALDTRTVHGPLAAGAELDLDLAALGVLPDGTTSVVVNVTAPDPAGDGYLTVWDGTLDRPGTSTLNTSAGRTVAVHAICACSSGRLRIHSSVATDVIVDVQGAFSPAGTLGLRPAARRLHDSRTSSGALGAGTTLTVEVPAIDGVPPAAVLLNLIATDVARGGYVAVWPDGSAPPATSNLNVAAGDAATANTVHVPVGADGRVRVRTTAEAALIVDLVAVYDDADGGRWYQAAVPARVLDTRTGTGGWLGAPAADQAIDVAVEGAGDLLAAGLTALPATGGGYVVAWSGEGDRPTTSTLNLATDQVRAVCALVPRSAAGSATITTVGGGGADLLLDVTGWFVVR